MLFGRWSGIVRSGVWLERGGQGAYNVSENDGVWGDSTRKTEDFARLKVEIMTSG